MFHDIPKNPEVVDTPKNLSPAVNEIKPQRGTTPDAALGIIDSLFTRPPESPALPQGLKVEKANVNVVGGPDDILAHHGEFARHGELSPLSGLDDGLKNLDDGLSLKETDSYYTTYKDRIDQTPSLKPGSAFHWDGARGESACYPTEKCDQNVIDALAKYHLDHIDYKNGEPDFSKCSEATVTIDHMTEDRLGNNFPKAREACAKLWNEQGRDGRSDWTAQDVENWSTENKYSWHERCDTHTMDLVPQDIHGSYGHSGGVAECKARDNNGGGYDE